MLQADWYDIPQIVFQFETQNDDHFHINDVHDDDHTEYASAFLPHFEVWAPRSLCARLACAKGQAKFSQA